MKHNEELVELKKGDRVIITEGPSDKVGKIGKIIVLASNGVVIKFPDGWGTAVKFKHLRKYE